MPRDFYYIVGTDCAVRRNGKVRQQPIFDGPHNSEEEAHGVAQKIVVAGDYEVQSYPTPSRDVARQTYNHNLALKVGAGEATGNKYQLEPNKKQVARAEHDAAWNK